MDISEFELHARVEDIHWWFKARREIIFDQLKRYVPPNKGKLIAEIGCGTGGNLKFLNDYYQVIGIDTSPEAVRYARKRVNGRILVSDFRDALAGSWNEVDAVILADVLEHIDDHTLFFRDLIMNLKPGAALLITVPAHECIWSRHDIVLGHKRRYSAKSLRSLWKDLPVKELVFSPFNCLLFPVMVLYRKFKSNINGSGWSDLNLPSPDLNYLLYKIFSTERLLLKLSLLPWGLSYLALLMKIEG